MPATLGRASKTKTVNGRIVSAKSKTGDSQCSQAVSDWKRNGMTPLLAAILGKCRASAHARKKAEMHEAAGNDGKAAILRRKAENTAPTNAADRLARARALQGARQAKTEATNWQPREGAAGLWERLAPHHFMEEKYSRAAAMAKHSGLDAAKQSIRGRVESRATSRSAKAESNRLSAISAARASRKTEGVMVKDDFGFTTSKVPYADRLASQKAELQKRRERRQQGKVDLAKENRYDRLPASEATGFGSNAQLERSRLAKAQQLRAQRAEKMAGKAKASPTGPTLMEQAAKHRAGKGNAPLRSALATQAKRYRSMSVDPRNANQFLKAGIKTHVDANTDVSTVKMPTKRDIKRQVKTIDRSKVVAPAQKIDSAARASLSAKPMDYSPLTGSRPAVGGASPSSEKYFIELHRGSGPKKSWKSIEKLPYGSPEQTVAANRHWKRLERFRARHDGTDLGELANQVQRKLAMSDTGYLANRRFFERLSDNRHAQRGTSERVALARRLKESRRIVSADTSRKARLNDAQQSNFSAMASAAKPAFPAPSVPAKTGPSRLQSLIKSKSAAVVRTGAAKVERRAATLKAAAEFREKKNAFGGVYREQVMHSRISAIRQRGPTRLRPLPEITKGTPSQVRFANQIRKDLIDRVGITAKSTNFIDGNTALDRLKDMRDNLRGGRIVRRINSAPALLDHRNPNRLLTFGKNLVRERLVKASLSKPAISAKPIASFAPGK